MCKSWCEAILAVIIIVFALWESVYASFGKWIVVIAGVVLLIHSFMCKKCFGGMGMMNDSMASKKRRR